MISAIRTAKPKRLIAVPCFSTGKTSSSTLSTSCTNPSMVRPS
jgi:hypothetical protein